MTLMFILNRQAYDGTDITWNALRLARQLHNNGQSIRIFLMNDSVDLVRDGVPIPEGAEDMGAMLDELISQGVEVKVCGTCQQRCGLLKGQPYRDESLKSTMAECASWVVSSEKVLTF